MEEINNLIKNAAFTEQSNNFIYEEQPLIAVSSNYQELTYVSDLPKIDSFLASVINPYSNI